MGFPVICVSNKTGEGLDQLRELLHPNETIVMIGSSGVGKSTLINTISRQDLRQTGEIRESDGKGRHTTTSSALLCLPDGTELIDTPGIRELRVWDLGEGIEQTFPEIEELVKQCRFRDCRHESEPGCAVLTAVESGGLDPERLASYRKLLAEAAFQQRKNDPAARAELTALHRTAMKTLKYHPNYKNKS